MFWPVQSRSGDTWQFWRLQKRGYTYYIACLVSMDPLSRMILDSQHWIITVSSEKEEVDETQFFCRIQILATRQQFSASSGKFNVNLPDLAQPCTILRSWSHKCKCCAMSTCHKCDQPLASPKVSCDLLLATLAQEHLTYASTQNVQGVARLLKVAQDSNL